MKTDDEYDFTKDFGEGNLADPIPVRPFDEVQLRTLKQRLDDLYFNIGAVDEPRGPILMSLPLSDDGTIVDPEPVGPVEQPPPPPPPGGKPPPGGRVIPCDNVIIDE